jgi:hypothetical protein
LPELEKVVCCGDELPFAVDRGEARRSDSPPALQRRARVDGGASAGGVLVRACRALHGHEPSWVEGKVKTENTEIDLDAFPTLKAMIYTVFYKFYMDPDRKPSRSDGFDVLIASVLPYVDAVFTERHQAEVLRKTKRRDPFLDHLQVMTLRDPRVQSVAAD